MSVQNKSVDKPYKIYRDIWKLQWPSWFHFNDSGEQVLNWGKAIKPVEFLVIADQEQS